MREEPGASQSLLTAKRRPEKWEAGRSPSRGRRRLDAVVALGRNIDHGVGGGCLHPFSSSLQTPRSFSIAPLQNPPLRFPSSLFPASWCCCWLPTSFPSTSTHAARSTSWSVAIGPPTATQPVHTVCTPWYCIPGRSLAGSVHCTASAFANASALWTPVRFFDCVRSAPS